MPTLSESTTYQIETDSLKYSLELNKKYKGEAGQHVQSEIIKLLESRSVEADLLAKELGI